MALNRLKKYISFYKVAHNERVKLYNIKWRLFFVLLVASVLILVNEYLQGRYPYTVYDALKSTTFPLSDRIFEWFAMGVIFGALALSLMYEGEFLLSLRRLVHFIEEQTRQMIGVKKKKRK